MPMLHARNDQIESQPTGMIEGQPNTGTFLIKALMHGDSMMLLEIRVRAGESSALHAHSHESLIYVVSGRLKTTIGKATFELGPGDACRHPPAVAHRVQALEDSVFVEIKSPPVEMTQVIGAAA